MSYKLSKTLIAIDTVYMLLTRSSASASYSRMTIAFPNLHQPTQAVYSLASTSTAMSLATQVRKGLAPCISKWYTKDLTINQKRHDQIRQYMAENPSYSPSAIMIAVLQKQCGKFHSDSK